MNDHSPEPWKAPNGGGAILTADGNRIPPLYDDGMNGHDARRIVACVNACRNIPNATLEKYPDLMRNLATQATLWDNVFRGLVDHHLDWLLAHPVEHKQLVDQVRQWIEMNIPASKLVEESQKK